MLHLLPTPYVLLIVISLASLVWPDYIIWLQQQTVQKQLFGFTFILAYHDWCKPHKTYVTDIMVVLHVHYNVC